MVGRDDPDPDIRRGGADDYPPDDDYGIDWNFIPATEGEAWHTFARLTQTSGTTTPTYSAAG